MFSEVPLRLIESRNILIRTDFTPEQLNPLEERIRNLFSRTRKIMYSIRTLGLDYDWILGCDLASYLEKKQNVEELQQQPICSFSFLVVSKQNPIFLTG